MSSLLAQLALSALTFTLVLGFLPTTPKAPEAPIVVGREVGMSARAQLFPRSIARSPEVTISNSQSDIPPTVREVIRSAALLYGQDAELMERIAFCESSLRPDAVNPDGNATGLFQIQRATWQSNVRAMGAPYAMEDRVHPAASSVVAAYIMTRRGTQPWEASRGCWE